MRCRFKMTEREMFLFRMGMIGVKDGIRRTMIYEGKCRIPALLNRLLGLSLKETKRIEQTVEFRDIRVLSVRDGWLSFETDNSEVVEQRVSRV